MGASGSGTTTLGRELAECWGVPHADADDYLWVPSVPPYVTKRPTDQRIALMRELFVPRAAWVLSGSMVGWGEPVIAECDAIIFLTLDPVERVRRLEEREVRRRAGLAYDRDAWRKFLDWAVDYERPEFSGRSRAGHDAWLRDVGKPVLQMDSSAPLDQLVRQALAWETPLSST